MKGKLRLGFLLPALILLMLLAVLVISSTDFEVRGDTLEDGRLVVTTEFPNASCRKVLTPRFPFVHLSCTEKPEIPPTLPNHDR